MPRVTLVHPLAFDSHHQLKDSEDSLRVADARKKGIYIQVESGLPLLVRLACMPGAHCRGHPGQSHDDLAFAPLACNSFGQQGPCLLRYLWLIADCLS
jgi:hypothetical protein